MHTEKQWAEGFFGHTSEDTDFLCQSSLNTNGKLQFSIKLIERAVS